MDSKETFFHFLSFSSVHHEHQFSNQRSICLQLDLVKTSIALGVHLRTIGAMATGIFTYIELMFMVYVGSNILLGS